MTDAFIDHIHVNTLHLAQKSRVLSHLDHVHQLYEFEIACGIQLCYVDLINPGTLLRTQQFLLSVGGKGVVNKLYQGPEQIN